MNLITLRRDDPVRVFDNLDRGSLRQEGYPGTVHSVGRKYLVISFRRNPAGHLHDIRVQISDGKSPDLHRQYTVLPGRVAERNRAREEDRLMLLRAGLSFTSSGFESLMDDELLHKVAELLEPYVLTTVAERTRSTGS